MHVPGEYTYPPSIEDVGREDEEEDYEVEPAELIRAAATLDTLAKLITVEEVCILHVQLFCVLLVLF